MDIKQIMAENEAMRKALRERHAKENGIPRKTHTGYILLSVRVQDMRVRQGTRDLKNAALYEYETAFPTTTTPIVFLKPRIEAELTALAVTGEYAGETPPRLYETRFNTNKNSGHWIVTAVFDKEFSVKGG